MGSNRYVNLNPTGYNSMRIPMPFEELAAIGETKQKDFDATNAIKDALPGLENKVKALDVVKGYGPQGLDYYKTGNAEKVHSYFTGVKQDLDKIAEDVASGKMNYQTYKTKVRQKGNEISQLISPTGEFGKMTQNYETYQKMQDDLSKNKDVSKADWLAHNMYANVGNMLSGKGDLQQQSLGEYVDRPKEVKDFFGSLGEEVTSSWSGADKKGYINTHYREGRTKGKIENTFLPWYNNSQTKQDILTEGNHLAASHGMDPNEQIEVSIPNDNGKGSHKEKMKWIDAYEEHEVNNLKEMALGFTSSKGKDETKDDSTWQFGEKQKQDAGIPLTSFVERAGFASQFKGFLDIENKYNDLNQSNNQIVNKASQYTDANGNKVLFQSQIDMLKMLADGKSNFQIKDFAANDKQKDILRQYIGEIEQNKTIKQQTEQYDNKIKTEAGLDKNWKPSENAIKKGEEAFNNSIISQNIGNPDASFSDPNQIKIAEEERNKAINKYDPTAKKYNDILEANAKNNTETLGVNSFTNKTVQDQVASILERDLNENGGLGAKDLKTDKELGEQYKDIGKIDPKQVGYFFDSKDNQLYLTVRPYKKGTKPEDGELMDYVKVKAPQGVLQHLMKEGSVNNRQLAATQILSNANSSPDFTSNMNVEGHNVSVRFINNTGMSNAPNGDQYEISIDGNKTRTLPKENAIEELIHLVNQ